MGQTKQSVNKPATLHVSSLYRFTAVKQFSCEPDNYTRPFAEDHNFSSNDAKFKPIGEVFSRPDE